MSHEDNSLAFLEVEGQLKLHQWDSTIEDWRPVPVLVRKAQRQRSPVFDLAVNDFKRAIELDLESFVREDALNHAMEKVFERLGLQVWV